MKAGIIAAGTGERLRQANITTPKPLITIGGEPLIARAIRSAAVVKAASVACIVNDVNPSVARYLRSGSWPLPVDLIVKTTSSSMESLFELAPLLSDDRFLLFTVDAVFRLETLQQFLTQAQAIEPAQGVLALTRFVDDEKPLWVAMDAQRRIIATGDAAGPTDYVTAGFYYFSPDVFALVETARNRKLNALRQFLGLLVESGYALYGVRVSKTLDIDYPEDIAKAEAFLSERG